MFIVGRGRRDFREIEQGEMSDAVSKSYEEVKRVVLWAGLI